MSHDFRGRFPEPNKLQTTNYYDHETITIVPGDLYIYRVAIFRVFRYKRKSDIQNAVPCVYGYNICIVLHQYETFLQRVQKR